MTVLQDNRKFQAMTVAEADAIFQRIALLEATIKRESSAADKKKAEIAIALQEKIAPALEERDELVETLTFYIQANPDRFIKPRKHKVGEKSKRIRRKRLSMTSSQLSSMRGNTGWICTRRISKSTRRRSRRRFPSDTKSLEQKLFRRETSQNIRSRRAISNLCC